MKKIGLVFLLFAFVAAHAQNENPSVVVEWKSKYRSFATKINDLVHTKLEAKVDYSKSYLYGKAWLTLHPHFYPTDSLTLDAKGMIINSVQLVKGGKMEPLGYTYDSSYLNIVLDRTYKKNEQYTVYIDYTSRPDEGNYAGSSAITEAKGLYFINPKGTEKNKPTQIWTQGETEANSVWIPTIDKPNQKTTQEFYLTVPDKYVTLSNGLLISQQKNTDGTRTDYWKMDLPHAPYLMFFGVGEFAIVKDHYKNKEVNYYVEKEYKDVARKIFGNTPEMIQFYSKILGVEYPWSKYSQIVVRDYVSGAMENTTATLHTEALQQNARQLVDGNEYENYVAHELFHQWFGDYVTAETWSNITVNESFANYSETLWNTYKYGADAGDDVNHGDFSKYLRSRKSDKILVRNYYKDKEDVFDQVSYEKGGRILHMLRNYIGDSAFFASLNLYLNTYKFGNGNAHKLRLAFEAVTGQDLNWYFNQWYFSNGHPQLTIDYGYDATAHKASVVIKQTQKDNKFFKLPIAIDIYSSTGKKRYNVWAEHQKDSFSFEVAQQPDLINVDGDKILLAEKTDNKPLSAYIYQYKYAKKYLDRLEAIEVASKNLSVPEAFSFLKQEALNDQYAPLREKVIEAIGDTTLDASTLSKIEVIAKKDPSRKVKAKAIKLLGKQKNKNYEAFFIQAANDSSYSVAGQALMALSLINEDKALELLPAAKKDAMGVLKQTTDKLSVLTKTDADFDEMTSSINKLGLFQKAQSMPQYLLFLGNVSNVENFKKGLDIITQFRDQVAPYAPDVKEIINKSIRELKAKKADKKAKGKLTEAAYNDQVKYIDEQTKD